MKVTENLYTVHKRRALPSVENFVSSHTDSRLHKYSRILYINDGFTNNRIVPPIMIAMSSTRSERRHRTMVPAPALLLLLLLASPLASAQPAGAKNVLYLVRVQFFFRQRKKPDRLLVSPDHPLLHAGH